MSRNLSDITVQHLKACTELSAVTMLPQLRLSINNDLYHRKNGKYPDRTDCIECRFCFQQYQKDYKGKICKLCKRELPELVDKSKVKPKMDKTETFMAISTGKSELLNLKKKEKKSKTAGLVLPGKITNPHGVLVPGRKVDPSQPLPVPAARTQWEEKVMQQKISSNKKKLKGLLYQATQQKKQSSNLQNFLNKII